MAQIAISLRVFVASPRNVEPLRKLTAEVIEALAAEVRRDRILLSSYLWEVDARPTGLGIGELISEELDGAELVVAVFGPTLGSGGTLAEIELAENRAKRGLMDDVLVYLREADQSEEAGSDGGPYSFRTELEVLERYPWPFRDPAELRSLLKNHLYSWIRPWQRVPEICDYALQHSGRATALPEEQGENRLARLRCVMGPVSLPKLDMLLGQETLQAFQTGQSDSPDPSIVRFDRNSLRSCTPSWTTYLAPRETAADQFPSAYPLVQVDEQQVRLADHEWMYFFCALGAADAIRRDHGSLLGQRSLPNEVHQYLKALLAPEKEKTTATLLGWLGEPGQISSYNPVVRSFAAYVLGMIHAKTAENALAEAARLDRGIEVAQCCIASLGKLRARRKLGLLVDMFSRSENTETRIVISLAVCRIAGIAGFEL